MIMIGLILVSLNCNVRSYIGLLVEIILVIQNLTCDRDICSKQCLVGHSIKFDLTLINSIFSKVLKSYFFHFIIHTFHSN